MTTKEKAKKLIERFGYNCRECDNVWNAKQFALVALNEMHEFAVEYMSDENLILALADIEEIKKEIQKL